MEARKKKDAVVDAEETSEALTAEVKWHGSATKLPIPPGVARHNYEHILSSCHRNQQGGRNPISITVNILWLWTISNKVTKVNHNNFRNKSGSDCHTHI